MHPDSHPNPLPRLLPLLAAALLLLSGLALAAQNVTSTTAFTLVQNNLANPPWRMTSDITLNARMRLGNASTGGPASFFLPRNITDLQDLSEHVGGPSGNAIYMCPGQLHILIQESSTWNSPAAGFAATGTYPVPPPPNTNRACPNILLGCGGTCNTACPGPVGVSVPVQWVNDAAFMNRLRANLARYVDQSVGNIADYNRICVPLPVNANYYPTLRTPPPGYPNSKSEAGLLCSGVERATLDGNALRRQGDNAASPGPLASTGTPACGPVPAHTWLSGTIGVGIHTLQASIGAQECLGIIHPLPDVANLAQNWKDIFRDNTNGFPAVNPTAGPASWRVVVVDPKSCPVSIEPLPCRTREQVASLHNLTLNNTSPLFGLNITNASVVDPRTNWTMRVNTNLTLVVGPNSSRNLSVTLTPTQPIPDGLKSVVLGVSYTSDVNFCDGRRCTNSTNITILLCNDTKPNLVPSFQVSPNPVVMKGSGPFNAVVRVTTTNVGSGATKNPTTTQFNISGAQVATYAVPAGLRTGESRTGAPFTYTCTQVGFVPISAYADYQYTESESDEGDNYQEHWINCGGVLACPDYI